MNRRTVLKSLLYAAPLPLATSCANNILGSSALMPKHLVTTNMILSQLLPHFPYNQEMQGLGSLSLSNPSFSMAPEINKVRIGLGLNASVANGIGSMLGIPGLNALGGQSRSGKCQMACGLRYDSKSRNIFLKDPVLEDLQLMDIPQQYTEQAQGLINTLGPKLLNKYPIHTLQPSLATRALKTMEITNGGIKLGFGL